MNIVSRFLGGAASDAAAGRRGMRGRMWVLLLLLLLEGVFCLLVGISHNSLGATVSGAALLGVLQVEAAFGSFCLGDGNLASRQPLRSEHRNPIFLLGRCPAVSKLRWAASTQFYTLISIQEEPALPISRYSCGSSYA